MSSTTELMSANKASANVFYGLTTKAFEGLEKYIDLNLQTARAAIAESAANTQAALSSKDAQEFLSSVSLLNRSPKKMTAYSRQLYDIAMATTVSFRGSPSRPPVNCKSKFFAAISRLLREKRSASATQERRTPRAPASVAAANKGDEACAEGGEVKLPRWARGQPSRRWASPPQSW